mmetsp:Transcript_8378/g.14368  ORF Transcript_8378/g.14368 Transcript_8378/m.14368 type:complete len:396 (-) Transcript_8378:1090-2277(-)
MMAAPVPCTGSRGGVWDKRQLRSAFGCSQQAHRRGQPICAAAEDKGQQSAAEADKGQQAAAQPGKAATQAIDLPRTGYFALADTNQEVYSKLGSGFDPAAKPGRYQSSFIWNTDWKKALEMQESLQAKRQAVVDREAANLPDPDAVPQGAVSFALLSDLDRMDMDMSAIFKEQSAKAAAQRVLQDAAKIKAEQLQKAIAARPVKKFKASPVPLPRNDIKRLIRSERFFKATRATTVSSSKLDDTIAKAAIAAAELVQYEADKMGARNWTAGASLIGAVSTYASYGREVCISYTLGALGGYLYLRLLGRSVDGVAGAGLAEGIASSVGSQRLLIPVILALGYNRWESLYAEPYSLHLDLLAILVGFLTYKLAVFARQGKQVMDDLSTPRVPDADQA